MTQARPHQRPQRILAVDDDEEVLFSIKTLLLRRTNIPGLEVVTSSSAEEALGLLKVTKFDAVISDHRMQGMSGLDLLTEVRARFPGTARVMITGYNDRGVQDRAIDEAGVHAFITKPWAPDAFIHTIRRVLKETRQAEAFEHAVEQGLIGVRPMPQIPPAVRARMALADDDAETEAEA